MKGMNIIFIVLVLFPYLALAQERTKGEVTWNNRVAVSGGLKGGNSETAEIKGEIRVNRNELWVHEWTIGVYGAYQTAQTNLLSQNAGAYVRFGWSITRALYNFYRVEVRHDEVSKTAFETVPTTGFGFWFFDETRFRWLAEAGGGYRGVLLTDASYRNDIVMQVRMFLEWEFLDKCFTGIDAYYYPGLSFQTMDGVFYIKVSAGKLAARTEFTFRYNTSPAPGAFPADYGLNAGLEWNF